MNLKVNYTNYYPMQSDSNSENHAMSKLHKM